MKGKLLMLNSLLICAVLLGCSGHKDKSVCPRPPKCPSLCGQICVCKNCKCSDNVVVLNKKGDKVLVPVIHVDFVKITKDGEIFLKIKKTKLKASDVCTCLDNKTFGK